MTFGGNDEEPLVPSPHRNETLRFTLRISKFSRVVTRSSVFSSNVFRNNASGSGWSLVVRAGGDSSTVFQLHRKGHQQRRQSVRVRLTIVDCLGSCLLSTKRQIFFQGSEGEAFTVMRVKDNQIIGWRGLKSLCFLPNDTLTLRCEITELGEEKLSYYDKETHKQSVGCAGWSHSFILSIPAIEMSLA